MKRALIPLSTTVIGLVVATLTACSAVEPRANTAPEVGSSSETTATTPAETETNTAADAGTPIDGSWRVAQSVADAFRAMEEAGLGRWADTIDIFQGADPDALYEMDVKLQDGQVLTTATLDGTPLGVIDRQVVEVEGERVRFAVDGSTCAATLRWTLHEASLRLKLMKDTCPDYNGTPDAAYMTVIYTAAPFERVD